MEGPEQQGQPGGGGSSGSSGAAAAPGFDAIAPSPSPSPAPAPAAAAAGIQSARVAAAVTSQAAAANSRLAMTEALGGPFAAYQQGKAALPDGRRVSNWYLITPEGGQVGLCH